MFLEPKFQQDPSRNEPLAGYEDSVWTRAVVGLALAAIVVGVGVAATQNVANVLLANQVNRPSMAKGSTTSTAALPMMKGMFGGVSPSQGEGD